MGKSLEIWIIGAVDDTILNGGIANGSFNEGAHDGKIPADQAANLIGRGQAALADISLDCRAGAIEAVG
jgi:hypothetical protein